MKHHTVKAYLKVLAVLLLSGFLLPWVVNYCLSRYRVDINIIDKDSLFVMYSRHITKSPLDFFYKFLENLFQILHIM